MYQFIWIFIPSLGRTIIFQFLHLSYLLIVEGFNHGAFLLCGSSVWPWLLDCFNHCPWALLGIFQISPLSNLVKYCCWKYNLDSLVSVLVILIWLSCAGRSDWDDGRWEWEETPRRESHSNTRRHHQPSPSPMLIGASPDARLVSPWLGGHTPQSGMSLAKVL